MTTLFIILIVLASVILGLIVLVQNPKGGGLAGNIGGFSNQLMGVKQTTDVLEKGTWIFGGVVAALCLMSVVFISKSASSASDSGATEATINKDNKTQTLPAGTFNPNAAGAPAATPTTPAGNK